jgi:hypothetical protein
VTLDVFLRLARVLELDLRTIADAPPPQRKMNPKRARGESALARLVAEMTETELDLLIRIGKLLRRSRTS